MARARGSYPRCRGFDSPSRYYISESSSLCELLFLLFISYYLSPIIYLSGEKNPISREESYQWRRIPLLQVVIKNKAFLVGVQSPN